MKVSAIAVGSLLFANLASAKCSAVQVLNVEPSSQRIRILTLHGGTPVGNARVEVFFYYDEPRMSVSTNKEGVARLRISPPGKYTITAKTADGLDAEIILAVSKSKQKTESSFTLNLVGFDDKIVAAEKAAAIKVRQFAGIVTDPSGAALAQAKIEVFKKGSRGKLKTAATESNPAGHFFAQLPQGFYTAVFNVYGFRTCIAVFEIAKGDDSTGAKDLTIMLQLGLAPPVIVN
jgi:hypothetical protein